MDQGEGECELTETNEKIESNGLKESHSSTSSATASAVTCDLETVVETNHHNETCTMEEYSDERHSREEVTKVLEQEETIERVNVTNSVQVSEVNLMINAEGNQEKLEVYNEKVSFEMAGNRNETTIGLYKEEVFVTAIEEIVVLTNEQINYTTTESSEQTSINTEEAIETALMDKTQEVNGTSKEENFENGQIEVEAENCLESANNSQYFSAEDTFNVSQDFDCTEETAWKFSKQVTSEAENISNGHQQVESEDSVSQTKTSTASQHEKMVELEQVGLDLQKYKTELSDNYFVAANRDQTCQPQPCPAPAPSRRREEEREGRGRREGQDSRPDGQPQLRLAAVLQPQPRPDEGVGLGYLGFKSPEPAEPGTADVFRGSPPARLLSPWQTESWRSWKVQHFAPETKAGSPQSQPGYREGSRDEGRPGGEARRQVQLLQSSLQE